MKALLFKEFRLAMHPICYVFILVCPLLSLIPSYPLAVGFIYVLTTYPILFLGANKGQQSNDLLFSTLLPVRKKDIVLARMITVITLHFVYALLISALYPLIVLVQNAIPITPGGVSIPGIPLEGFISIIGIGYIGFAIADIIFFPIYYKNGKSIVMSTLFTILGFIIYLGLFTIVLVYIPGCEWYIAFLCGPIWVQLLFLAGALLLYFILHLLTYHISARRLEKVDF